ncbi:MAG TPA: YXWGXW repeat-containing protein [Methylocystis sp.]|nr:YXWGXW repeat-containing protein [Methylocystis sp.]
MTTKQILSPLVGAAAFILIGASVAGAQAVVFERAMPAPIVEVVPAAPAVGMSWVPGHWVWREHEWFWVKGHYVVGAVPAVPALIEERQPPRPSSEHVWVRGHWAWEGARWNWRPGIWFRP